MSGESGFEDFDCIQPSLIQQIKIILDQYPDDGQILKELIQNAEDAKAKEVKFLYDHHSYGTEKLHTQDLAKFQGPALYAYNDAIFSTDDWKGVRMLSESIKKKDPTKVGRFGLGFKSVFHMTDLPSVISGDSVAIIDPEEKYFSDNGGKRSGRKWHLKNHQKNMQTIPDHFLPYQRVFGCSNESFERGSYEGTLFRLPLRQEASKLSNTIYSQEKMKGLLECFEKDAHLILLFLMNLERIEIYDREAHSSQPRKLFHVRISEHCLTEVRKAREEFSTKVQENVSALSGGYFPEVKQSYTLTIETARYSNGVSNKAEHSFVITNLFSGSDVSVTMQELIRDASLSYMPWIGVALPIATQLKIEEDADDFEEPKGHLFCFLPLPLESKSLTGLPVHVNGFFALSQNRRHLKWPSADQDETIQPLTDKSLQWNKGLLQEVLPKAYAELILHVISCLTEEEPLQTMTTSDAYSAWPDVNKVDVKWKNILKPLFEILLQSKVLHTDANGGGWCKVEEVLLDSLEKGDQSMRRIVIDLHNRTGQKVVTAPAHVKTALQECRHINYVTPKTLRESLKAYPSCYSCLSHQDKILLLTFVLSDSNFTNLKGLELLPLSDKTFTTFRGRGVFPIYIDSAEHPKSLLPGLQRMFLDTDLDDTVTDQLKNAVEKGHTQLCYFNKEAVIRHLRQMLPSDWLDSEDHVPWHPGISNHPTIEWLKTLWEYFGRHFAHTTSDLDAFNGLPLVPVTPLSNQSEVHLARIQRPSSLVLASFNGENIDESVCHVLEDLGLTILKDLPECIRHYPELVPSFVNPASPKGILHAMAVIFKSPQRKDDLLQKMRVLSADKIGSFRTFLSSLSSLTPNEACLLRQLPMFETYVGCGERLSRFVSLEEVNIGAPVDDLPAVSVFTDLLDLRDRRSRALAQLLNTFQMSLIGLLKTLLDDALGNNYAQSEVDVLAKYTLERFGSLHGEDLRCIKQKLQCLSFVVSSDKSRKKPTELFNPEDDLLTKIFLGEEVFPEMSYYSQPEVNAHLKNLGLKGQEKITPSDVLNSANLINNIQNIDKARVKSLGLLQLLEKNYFLLQAAGNGLRSTIWVPVLRTKPNTYSTHLPLKGGENAGFFTCPNNLTSHDSINIIGSVKLLVNMPSESSVSTYFGWHQNPCTADVLKHLKNVVFSYHVEDKSNFIFAVKEIYGYLSNIRATDVIDGMRELQLAEWVWNGEGFCTLSDVVLENPWINLAPYVRVLPTETREFSLIFTRCGMKQSCDADLLLNVLLKIREKHESSRTTDLSVDVKRDLQLATDILNELKPKNGQSFDTNVRKRLLVPVHVEDDARLELKPVGECTYYDRDWLKQGHDVIDIDDQDDVKISFIHQNIPDTTAELLGVPTLMSRILGAEELELGESFGQSESLLDRIRGLLDGYTDGLSVPKELIQNADDAGATEVRILYDERTNEDCMTRLIDEGMKECQGPALWAYNDAVFSDEDFQNIVKLNAATKKEDSRKIGRFGLGFNSVYNLTDVPSFVSRNSIVILDPHTTYLGKGIREKSKPGIKLRMEERKLCRLENQFKPYNGIFGCDLRPGAQQKSYNGTLFRLPLRTASQALKSGIKNLHYDGNQVKELLGILFHGAESLLLFTQNVLRVTVYHLRNESTESPEPVELFRISKSCRRVVHQLQSEVSLSNSVQQLTSEEQEFVKQSSILKASSSFMEQLLNGNFSSLNRVFMKSSMILNCQCALSDQGKEYLAAFAASGGTQVSWLVTSCMVKGEALKMASRNKGLLPTAGVAAKLTEVHPGNFVPVPIAKPFDSQDKYQDSTSCHNGGVFCFLPLPIHSGLPVHINGCFAVSDNRRYLRERTEEDKTDQGAVWNDVLMREVVCQTYISMLDDMKDLSSRNGYVFHSLWPRCSDVQTNCHGIASRFYSSLFYEHPELFSDNHEWTSMQNVVFLEPAFRRVQQIGQIAFDLFKTSLEGTNTIVVDMPEDVSRSFERYELQNGIQKMCYNKERFFSEVFFPAIDSIGAGSRNELVLYALDDTSEILRELVGSNRCIPSSPLGLQLKYPKELLNPGGKAAQLFSPEDGRFPLGDKFTSEERLVTLKRLGMRDDDLEWEEVIERAESVKSLVHYHQALERTKLILAFIDRKLDNDHKVDNDVQTRLQRVQFLPIMKKPEAFPFKWRGDEYQINTFLSAAELYPREVKYLASVCVPILDDSKSGCGHLNSKVGNILSMTNKTASLDQVKMQLKSAIAADEAFRKTNSFDEIKKGLEKMYDYLQCSPREVKEDIVDFLKPLEFILVEKHFLSCEQVAFSSEIQFPPYLCPMTESYLKFRELFMLAGVRESFEAHDYIKTLQKVKHKHEENPVTEELDKVVTVSKLVAAIMKKQDLEKYGTIFLPDSKRIMKPSTDVCVKDCYWMPDEEGVLYAYDGIPPKDCITLGAKTRRQETLSKCKRTFGRPFGQKEKLTKRLKRILDGYPGDESIMKELLQNADDAKAKKVCFINDPRQHPDERVFEECWKPLQGPALCVYNNAPFTKSDIEGIQNLGEGSKGDDPNKTGQYGVGFNAVYHLTDAPTFMSQGEEIGEVMCVFDPTLRFVPGADEFNPGGIYDNISYLKRIFTDVFPCYLGEHFPINNGTMFRFPFRNQEMAKEPKSCITPKCISNEDLNNLLDSFKNEMLEILLFVNNVKEISVFEIDKETGNMTEKYSVTASLSEEDEEKRRDFTTYVNLQSREISVTDIPLKKVSYVLELKDSRGLKQKWFVVQQIGFENQEDIPDNIEEAFERGDLGLLPRGGVASLISSSGDHQDTQGKAFCFLPLPFKTGLPVHINGHFALNHEDRRSLWRDDKRDYRSNWNDALLRQVVAPCYVTLLDEVRQHISLPRNANGKTFINGDRNNGECVLSNYFKYFPSFAVKEEYWKTLTREVYRYMNERHLPLLPVLRESFEGNQHQDSVCIEWLPSTGHGRNRAFFGSLSDKLPPYYESLNEEMKIKRLRDTLLALGINLLFTPDDIDVHNRFITASVDVSRITPKDVIDFFSTYNSSDQLCDVGNLPLPISKTPFRNIENLLRILKYCKQDAKFFQRLDGLPLLLTQDEVLGVFRQSDKIFLSSYCEILPSCSSMFVHKQLFNGVFHFDRDSNPFMSPVFKTFDIKDFASLLPREMDENHYRTTDRVVIWNPENKNHQIPNKQWIWHVWRFFSNYIEKKVERYDEAQSRTRKYPQNYHERKELQQRHELQDKEARKCIAQEALTPVMHWCLLPAFEANPHVHPVSVKHILLPMGMSNTVIDLESSTGFDLKETLKKILLPQLNCSLIDGESMSGYRSGPSKTAKRLVASLADPNSVLTVLLKKMSFDPNSFKAFEADDCLHVLGYFNNHLTKLEPSTAEKLKRLPLYETIHDDIISISGKQAYVLSSRIPKDDMHIWQETSGIVFLKENKSLEKLHEFLQCHTKDEVDVYCDIIFEKFEEICEEARIKHVIFVRELLNVLKTSISILSDEEITKKAKLAKLTKLSQALFKMKFMTAQDGALKPASSFYDPSNKVFAAMFKNNQEMFPPEPFCEAEWLPFLRRIGLIHEVSDAQFLKFAKEVKFEAETRLDDGTRKKSEALLTYLFESENIATSKLLDDVKEICFIFPYVVDPSLEAIHEQYGTSETGSPCICFQGSVASKNQYITWTTANLLSMTHNPLHCDNVTNQEKNEISQRLGILQNPSVDMVVNHSKNICNAQYQLNCTDNFVGKRSINDLKKIIAIMTSIYKYLQSNYNGNEKVINELKNIHCIVVDGGERFVFPNQVAVDITSDQEIQPYLYKIPQEVASYTVLFENLGTTNTITVAQYAEVLRSIYTESAYQKLDPNQISNAFKATKGLFDIIAKDDQGTPAEGLKLYLPGTMRNPDNQDQNMVFLRKSTHILYNDAPHFKERIEHFNNLILVKLSECGLNVANDDLLLKKLPQSIRPRMLTSVVHETLMDGDQAVSCSSTAQYLRQVLRSSEFCHGMIRLIKHADYKSDVQTSTEIPALVQERLRCIHVYSVPNLRTKLVYSGRAIPRSELDVSCFEEETKEKDQKVWKIYIEKEADLSTYVSVVAEIIDRITGHLLKTMLVHLPTLLSSKPYEIKGLLDRLKIREDKSVIKTEATSLPTPGSFIHITDHHLLVDDFTVFSPGEYVGYELDDPSLRGEDGTPTYIYAIVIEEVTEDGQPSNTEPSLRKYRIDIGKDKEPIVVDAADLYKFYRPSQGNSECLEMEPFTGSQDEKPASLDEHEIRNEIRRILQEAWKQPEEKRKKIIKRLYLKWHPDKNPGNEQFCTEVFKFIQQEIERLEKEERFAGRTRTRSSTRSDHSYSGFYSTFFNCWSGRARYHSGQRSSFYSGGGFSTFSWRSYRRNPQPGEARRWYKQAKADLEAASNDVDCQRTSYEWACFKCHQSAEKALKAAQYSKDADKTSTHSLTSLARELNNSTLQSLASQLECEVGNSMRMRYPDQVSSPNIPHDVYDKETALRAIKIASEIIQEVDSNYIKDLK